jgi:hypothetical protein
LIIDTDLDFSKPKKSYSSSIRDKGVRSKEILFKTDYWDIHELKANEEYAFGVFRHWEGTPYGWSDLLMQHVFRLPLRNNAIICSELVLLMLKVPVSITNSLNPGQAVKYALANFRE